MYQSRENLLAILVSCLLVLFCCCSKHSTKPETDTTLPVASTLFPPANATDVPIDTQIFITFSEAVRADTLEKQFQLLPNLERRDSVFYDPQSFKLTLISGKPLNYQTTYHCRIAPGITDLAGNPFSDNKLFIWSFTTRRDPSPYLVSIFPVDSSVNVEPDVSIQLTFNKAMNQNHLLEKFRLLSPEGAVTGALTYQETIFRLSFDPDSLRYRTTYTIELAEGIESTDGSVFNNGQRYQSIFTVRAPDQIQVLDFYPRETNVTSEVLDTLEFRIQAKGDSVSYSWYKDNSLDTDAKTGTFRTFFSTTGLHSIDAVVNDIYNQNASRHWNVDVRNTHSEFSVELLNNPGNTPYTVGDTVYLKIKILDITGLAEIGVDFERDGMIDERIENLSGKEYQAELSWIVREKGEFQGLVYIVDRAGMRMEFNITPILAELNFNTDLIIRLNEDEPSPIYTIKDLVTSRINNAVIRASSADTTRLLVQNLENTFIVKGRNDFNTTEQAPIDLVVELLKNGIVIGDQVYTPIVNPMTDIYGTSSRVTDDNVKLVPIDSNHVELLGVTVVTDKNGNYHLQVIPQDKAMIYFRDPKGRVHDRWEYVDAGKDHQVDQYQFPIGVDIDYLEMGYNQNAFYPVRPIDVNHPLIKVENDTVYIPIWFNPNVSPEMKKKVLNVMQNDWPKVSRNRKGYEVADSSQSFGQVAFSSRPQAGSIGYLSNPEGTKIWGFDILYNPAWVDDGIYRQHYAWMEGLKALLVGGDDQKIPNENRLWETPKASLWTEIHPQDKQILLMLHVIADQKDLIYYPRGKNFDHPR